MEAPLQQRIVGAIVLVTLGVIFIPALLDGSGYKSRQARSIEIKDKPYFGCHFYSSFT
jgi:DedD protein